MSDMDCARIFDTLDPAGGFAGLRAALAAPVAE
jgi:hypothetical protein